MHKSFSLIEMIVAIGIIILLAVAFTPGLTKHQQQVELEAATQQIQNAVYETRSLAISPNYISEDGAVMKHYFLILNITDTDRKYITQLNSSVVPSADDCRDKYGPGKLAFNDNCRWGNVPGKSYTIYAAESSSLSSLRNQIKQVQYPKYISIFYDYPCRGIGPSFAPNCSAGSGESYFWKPHFRNIDGMIGFDGRYFDYPDVVSGISTGYWVEELWGGNPTSVTKSNVTIVWGNISSPETTYTDCDTTAHTYTESGKSYPCKVLEVDNITGAINVL